MMKTTTFQPNFEKIKNQLTMAIASGQLKLEHRQILSGLLRQIPLTEEGDGREEENIQFVDDILSRSW